MAKPKFHVQHFVVCPRVSVGHAEPGNPYTLHDVKYTFDYPADREFPLVETELWVFIRIYFTRPTRQDFVVKRYWLDAPNGEDECGVYTLPTFTTGNDLVMSRASKLNFVRFPGPGRYSLRLSTQSSSPILAQDVIYVRRLP
jgi:hypothetical protein